MTERHHHGAHARHLKGGGYVLPCMVLLESFVFLLGFVHCVIPLSLLAGRTIFGRGVTVMGFTVECHLLNKLRLHGMSAMRTGYIYCGVSAQVRA